MEKATPAEYKEKSHSKVFIISNAYQKETGTRNMGCDLCGKKGSSGKLHMCSNYVYLCSYCLNYISSLPLYNQKCIERFIIGNVM